MSILLNNRTPIPQGSKIPINGFLFEILDNAESISAGSSCLVYHVYTNDIPDKHFSKLFGEDLFGTHYIMKEFYPLLENNDIKRDPVSHALLVSDETKQNPEYQRKQQQFMQGLVHMKEVSSTEANHFFTTPFMDGKYGDSFYIITEDVDGKDLEKEDYITEDSSLENILGHFCLVAEPFDKLHKSGILMLDIKPENLLSADEDLGILIADTDSLYHIGTPLNKNSLLFSNSKYAAPEIHNLLLFLEEDDFEMVPSLLTPYADMYSLGKYLYELIWKKPFLGRNLYDSDREQLLDEFEKFYSKESNVSIREIGEQLIDILCNVLIEDLFERSLTCYETVEEFYCAISDVEQNFFHLAHPNWKPLSDEEVDSLFEDLKDEMLRILDPDGSFKKSFPFI